MDARRMRGLIALVLGTLLSLSLAASAVAHVMEAPVSHLAGAVECTADNDGKTGDSDGEKSAPHAHASHCHHLIAPVDAVASEVPVSLRDIGLALPSRPLDPAPSDGMLRPPRA
ncbi:MAG: hypothetical protein CMN72_01995 [Sphingomonas sp.]|uniref:DUF2946 domain-containing protein n=1 Tax=Stakelama saccharophila TaxID=3075605 RepID=A0ABZ0B7Y0_9SPHN|nr:hypothetical protein [Stakelama sp. W311]MAW98421.1 hypothetical protein [Sphingomonas sp.]WNO53504.1 hypothetical protein RPR59_13830 [Stakelama sp. W311]|tara:strand:- start:123 stop:464 length:342 start_codon:yes stop_codon:yes gene_type:complete